MTAYLNVYKLHRGPLDDAGLRPGEHVYANKYDAAEEAAEDRDYRYTVVLDWDDLGRPTAKAIDLESDIRDLERDWLADRQHNAGLLAGAGRGV